MQINLIIKYPIVLCLIILFHLQNFLLAQSNQNTIQKVSLLTVSPGDDAYSYFGHTAIKVKGTRSAEDIVYNYGTFSFDQPNFYLNFLRGRLLYSLTKQKYATFLRVYHHEQRSVFEQTLNLAPAEEAKLIQALENNAMPKNSDYLYEFFFDNCSTRPRDIIASSVGGVEYGEYQDKTFRDLLEEYIRYSPWLDFGIDLIIGSKADRPASQLEQMFLPDYLHDAYIDATYSDNQLISSDYTVLDFSDVELRRKQKRPNYPVILILFLILVEGLFIYFRKQQLLKVFDAIWFGTLALGGIILCIMWFATEHYATKLNWNILWMHPLYFLVLTKKRAILHTCIVLLILASLCWLCGIQVFHWAVLPIILLTGLKLYRNSKDVQSQITT